MPAQSVKGLLLLWCSDLRFLGLRIRNRSCRDWRCDWRSCDCGRSSWCLLRILHSRQLHVFNSCCRQDLRQLLEDSAAIYLRQVLVGLARSFDLHGKLIARSVLEYMEVLQIGLMLQLA